jgi:hypothetical protein
MDNHHGLPHDLPEYVPNWPVPVRVKATVVKGRSGWLWAHQCPHKGIPALAMGYRTQTLAFAAALKHARGCW